MSKKRIPGLTRVQVYLFREQKAWLDREAKQQRETLSHVLRRVLRCVIEGKGGNAT